MFQQSSRGLGARPACMLCMKWRHLQAAPPRLSSVLARWLGAPAVRGFLQKGWACNVTPRGGAGAAGLRVGAGSGPGGRSHWLQVPVTGLNPPPGSVLPSAINTAGSSARIVRRRLLFCTEIVCFYFFIFFLFTQLNS